MRYTCQFTVFMSDTHHQPVKSRCRSRTRLQLHHTGGLHKLSDIDNSRLLCGKHTIYNISTFLTINECRHLMLTCTYIHSIISVKLSLSQYKYIKNVMHQCAMTDTIGRLYMLKHNLLTMFRSQFTDIIVHTIPALHAEYGKWRESIAPKIGNNSYMPVVYEPGIIDRVNDIDFQYYLLRTCSFINHISYDHRGCYTLCGKYKNNIQYSFFTILFIYTENNKPYVITNQHQ